jgi:hypothetical protein
VATISVIIRHVIPKESTQMLLVENDDVVEQLAVNRADPSLGDTILPWTPEGGS